MYECMKKTYHSSKGRRWAAKGRWKPEMPRIRQPLSFWSSQLDSSAHAATHVCPVHTISWKSTPASAPAITGQTTTLCVVNYDCCIVLFSFFRETEIKETEGKAAQSTNRKRPLFCRSVFFSRNSIASKADKVSQKRPKMIYDPFLVTRTVSDPFLYVCLDWFSKLMIDWQSIMHYSWVPVYSWSKFEQIAIQSLWRVLQG